MIQRDEWGAYHVKCANTSQALYSDLYSLHAAVAIAERLNLNQPESIPQVLAAEEQYARWSMALKHVSHVMAENPQRRDALAAKRQILEGRAGHSLRKLKSLRIIRF